MSQIALTPAEQISIRQLHDTHSDALHSWASRRFADPQEAEEVVQDTLVLAWRKRHQFDQERGSERAWMFGILRNVAASRHRSRRQHLRLLLSPPQFVDLVDGQHSPEFEVENSEITDALRSLSEDHRTVILESYFEGRPLREIAVRVGVPEGTVKSRLYYGLRGLRAELEERGVLR